MPYCLETAWGWQLGHACQVRHTASATCTPSGVAFILGAWLAFITSEGGAEQEGGQVESPSLKSLSSLSKGGKGKFHQDRSELIHRWLPQEERRDAC